MLKKPIGKSYKSEIFYSQNQEHDKNGLINGVSKSYQEEKHNINSNNYNNANNSNPYALQDSLKIFRNNASSNPVQIKSPSKQVKFMAEKKKCFILIYIFSRSSHPKAIQISFGTKTSLNEIHLCQVNN